MFYVIMEDLDKKDFEPESLVDKAIKDEGTLSDLMDGLKSKKDSYRYNSFQVLLLISEKEPEVLYPNWEHFAELLLSENNYHKVIGIKILANLVKIDEKDKLDLIFDEYVDLIKAKSIMTARTVVENLGKIAKFNPQLSDKITDILMDVENSVRDFQRKELIKADVVKAFSMYFDQIEEQEKVLSYVKGQLESDSPKTRKMANSFLKKYQ
ncbi:MAG: hypothetical protein BAJALOKI2v1_620012 [Promethearchaeota archaeon]|nr:MAG: hypothetical protein BAJALOKI2v1_620012 [Candidatus Lokiarchaeota archaeon]